MVLYTADREREPMANQTGCTGRRRIHCANCIHCKLVQSPVGNGTQYQLRVRCDAGKWRKKLGDEKYYKYFTVVRRHLDYCDSYEPMGDEKEFLRELKRSLPIRDEVYTLT
jgi:hypothetical protein